MNKKFLSFILVLIMIIGLIPAMGSVEVFATEISDWAASGDGQTAETAYVINSVTSLAAFAEYVNAGNTMSGKYIKLADDFSTGTMEKVIGNSDTNYFAGHFDGNGQTVNLNISGSNIRYAGLFGLVSGGAISNVNVTGSVSASGSGIRAGGVVGYLHSGKVETCNATVDVTATNTDAQKTACAGGVVGNAENSGSNNATIRNCYSQGDITATSSNSGTYDLYAGGITGYTDGIIEDCYAKGVVSANGYGRAQSGGIVGLANTGSQIKNCYASCTVSAISTSTNMDAQAGGIIGTLVGTLENSYATGDVTASGSGNSFGVCGGGVVGYNCDNNSKINNCYATGNVTATGKEPCAGGVVGKNKSGTVKNCYSTGYIKVINPTGGDDVGGIAGRNNAGTIINCYSIGTVASVQTLHAGGISGNNEAGGKITNCYSTAKIINSNTENTARGGIIGADFVKAFTSCYSINTAWDYPTDEEPSSGFSKINNEQISGDKENSLIYNLNNYVNTSGSEKNLLTWVLADGHPTLDMSSVHEHFWIYAASGNTITATTCVGIGSCNYVDNYLSITLSAINDNTTYDGLKHGATIEGISLVGLSTLPTITYQKKIDNSQYSVATCTAPKDAGTYKASITVQGTTASIEYTITKAALTINDASIDDKTYDGTKNATVTAVTFSGLIGNDTLIKDTDFTVSGEFDKANAEGSNKASAVTVTVELKDTSKANNYYISSTKNINKTIAKASQSINNPTASAIYSGKIELQALVAGQGNTKYSYNTTDTAPQNSWQNEAVFTGLTPGATYYFFAKYEGNDNYYAVVSNSTSITTNNHSHQWTYTANGETITATCSNGDFGHSETSHIITIVKPTLVKYGGAGSSAASITGGINGVSNPVIKYYQDGTELSEAPSSAGAYTAKITLDSTTASVEYIIEKRSVTLTSATKSKEYDGTALTDSTVTVSGDGFASGEGATYNVTGSQTTTGSSTNVFTYTLTGNTKADNYNITTVAGTLTVTEKNTTPSTPAGGGGTGGSTTTQEKKQTVEGNGVVANTTVKGETVSVEKIDTKAVGKGEAISLKLDALKSDVTSVKLVNDVVKNIIKAEAPLVEVKLPGVTVSLDSTVQKALEQKLGSSNVELSVQLGSKAQTALSDAQQKAISGMKNAQIVDAKLIVGGQTLDFGGGTVKVEVPYTAEAKSLVRAWYIDDSGNKEAVAASYKDGNVTFYAKHFSIYVIATEDMPFSDVTSAEYYFDSVLWALGMQITTGVSDDTFAPDLACTRAQMVTFLWRAAGCTNPSATTCGFKDVKTSDYFYKAVLWAVEQGITSGTSSTTFEPNATVNRAQTVTFIYRYEGRPTVTGSSIFTDVKQGQYYTDAVIWAKESGITSGVGDTKFGPKQSCSRGQIVTFLYRDIVD